MVLVSIVDMKATLSAYVDRAARGEQILICRHNKPVAELRPVAPRRSEPRPIGPLPGRPTFDVPAAFFEPMGQEELERWESTAATDPLASISGASTRRGAGTSPRRPKQPTLSRARPAGH